MRNCWRAPPRRGDAANPLKRPTIPSSTAAPFCWIRRSWKCASGGKPRANGIEELAAQIVAAPGQSPPNYVPTEEEPKSGDTLNLNGGAIGEHFGDTLHHSVASYAFR